MYDLNNILSRTSVKKQINKMQQFTFSLMVSATLLLNISAFAILKTILNKSKQKKYMIFFANIYIKIKTKLKW